MTRNALAVLWLVAAVGLSGSAASAQVPVVPTPLQSLPGINSNQSWRWEQVAPGHWRLTGDVELEKGDMRISADEVEIFSETNLLVATGNVTVTTKTQRISADKLEFNLLTAFGTFYHASGSARIGGDDPLNPTAATPAGTRATPAPPMETPQFGMSEPDLLFYGELIEQIGERKYRITNGGFTTCVQPEPRWQLQSGTVVLNIDHYAMLRNMVMNVKGVPVFYLPVIFYPINREDRSTGILMPVYGSSSLRGQTISNAFFWAINRSQDATVMYDWFSRTGQGMGGEYRFIRSATSAGEFRTYYLTEKAIETVDSAGNTSVIAGNKSFDLRGSVSQDLPLKLRARGRVDYFTNIAVQQAYNTNIFDASRRSRYFGGTVSGTWNSYNLSAAVDQSQYYYSTTDSSISGSMPRISFSRAEQPLFGSPVYVGVSTDYASLIRKTSYGSSVTDTGLNRLDLTPSIRYGFTKIPYFNINTSIAWRYTWWSESLSAETRAQVPQSISRTYYDLQARFMGPIFTKVWNTPDNFYAEKYKHTIEPWMNLQRVSSFENRNQIVQLDTGDWVYGGTTRMTFGLNNRVYAKHRAAGGLAREIVNVQIQQTYYSDEFASTVDPAYTTSFQSLTPEKLSPITLAARFTPNERIGASFNTSYNTYENAFLNFAAIGTFAYHDTLQLSGGLNRRNLVPGLPGYDNYYSSAYFLNMDGIFKLHNNRYGGAVSFNYDMKNGYFMQSRYVGYYNAQCCGISFEYQTYDYGTQSYYGVSKDRRFSMAVTLAGLGSFSPFFGGMSNPTNQMYR